MEAKDAYAIFEAIAEISGTQDKLHLMEPTQKESAEEENAEEVRELKHNRYNFKNTVFTSSLTGKKYRSTTKTDGSLGIYEYESGEEVISFSNPSKKQIVRTALLDLGEEAENTKTLYQLMHKLDKAMEKK